MAQVWLGPQNGLNYQTAVINSSSATIAAIAGVAGQIIRVYKGFLVTAGISNLTFEDGSTVLTGPLAMLANGSIFFPNDGVPWLTTSLGNALNIVNSGSVAVGGTLYYTTAPG